MNRGSSNKTGGNMKGSLVERITPLWGKMSYAQIAKIVGSTAESVRKNGRKAGLLPYKVNSQNRELSPEQELERDISLRSAKGREQKKDGKLKVAMDTIELLRSQLDVFKATQSEVNSITIKANGQHGNFATAVAVASDWHFGEVVEANEVNGLNEFNVEIARQRASAFFANTLKLVNSFKKDIRIDTIVLAILGDMISGNIHAELLENNETLPADQIIEVQSILASGIKLLADSGLKVKVVCHSGNHGRMTEKRRIATEAGNSLEYLMYHTIAKCFEGDNRVEFIIPRSYLSYVDINGFVVRFHHGHALRYAGGIGGIFIPAYKAVGAWNVSRKADLDVFGHFHQFRDGGQFVSNGSLVGWNAFATQIKAVFEKPKQGFFLIDDGRKEKTATCPIFLT
jgi:hypothetical protein